MPIGTIWFLLPCTYTSRTQSLVFSRPIVVTLEKNKIKTNQNKTHLLQEMMRNHLLLLLHRSLLLLLLLHGDIGRHHHNIPSIVIPIHLLLLLWQTTRSRTLCRWFITAQHLLPARRHQLIGQAVL